VAKAAFVGAKMVTSLRPSTVESRPVEFRVLANVVRPLPNAVAATVCGGVRTASMFVQLIRTNRGNKLTNEMDISPVEFDVLTISAISNL
jgi:hypothetical protein